MSDIIPTLTRVMARATGNPSEISNFGRLSGGANMESCAFDYAGEAYVLRRAPSDEMAARLAYGHDIEASIVRLAHASGVKAPVIVAELTTEDAIGSGYVMKRVMADVNPAVILADPPPSLLSDLAREAARIHAMPLDQLPPIPLTTPRDVLTTLKERFAFYGGGRPVMALAFKWLEDRLPPDIEPVFVHGDFRMGNVMVDKNGLAAVLDWELCHLGDRHQDLAYGCINSWRFGHIDRPGFGCGPFEELWSAYEAECGIAVDPDRFRWWLVYCTLWWGICCLQMAFIWRSGLDTTLERAVIGRRASETEADLLMLLEGDAPEAERTRFTLETAAPARRSGEPSSVEMLEALSGWIEKDVKAKAQGRDRFMAAVALNALGMLKREAEQPLDIHDADLCDDLMAGRQSLATPGLLTRLKRETLIKLAADQPKYSALAKARALWLAD